MKLREAALWGGGFPAALTKKNLNYLYAGGKKAASPQPPPPHTPRLSAILRGRHVWGGGFPAAEHRKIYDYFTMNDSKFLNFDQPIDKHTGGNLPHWHQDGKIQFVTFRLADSLPTAVIEELKYRKETFLRNHPRPWDMTVQKEYWNQIGPMAEQLLDNGHGSCLLRHHAVRSIVASGLHHNDGVNYNLIAYVIMPNHVHLLLHLPGNSELPRILQSIKGYTAAQINRLMNRKGKLWMRESFDRIVRSYSHLNQCLNYIKHNPSTLPASDYTLYLHPKYQQ